MMPETSAAFVGADTLQQLAAGAERADTEASWPAESWGSLAEAGVQSWSVPTEFGGRGLAAVELLSGYEKLAGACLTTAFLLSQREAAVRRIVEHAPESMRRAWLPALARGERFVTVGLSQLTTSRQHTAPAVVATPAGDGYRIDGVIPWVTGAERADALVTGATLPDGKQLLLLLPRDRAGVTVDPPFDLSALRGSLTAQVECRAVAVRPEDVMAGPVERVLGAGRGAGGLETSCLALGLASGAVEHLRAESAGRPDLLTAVARFESARDGVRRELHRLAVVGAQGEEATTLRVRASRLALQATQVALMVSKGSGFVRPQPAQRWARQALFFLVWSCPRPAAEGLLAHLLPEDDHVQAANPA